MVGCPHCLKQIEINEENFGTLFQCPYCHTEFFVDFNGLPENSKAPSIDTTEPPPAEIPGHDGFPRNGEILDHEKILDNKEVLEPIEPSQVFAAKPLIDVFEDQEQKNHFFDEVVAFGNDSKNYENVLSFDVTIEDIDLPEQKRDLIELLEDKRLGLDIDEIKIKLNSGKLKIENFPAAKAIVLIQRIQGLSLTVYWSQNVATH